jgi:hypothetical protein
MRRNKRICMTIGFLLSVTLILMNCGGGNGGVNGPSSQFGAYNFTAANMTTAASIAASTTGLWSPFGQITMGMMEKLQTGPTPAAGQPHDLGICLLGGTSTFTWNDNDSDTMLSPGDAVALSFVNCDVGTVTEHEYMSGTMGLNFTTVASGATDSTYTADVTIDVTSQSAETLRFSGVLQVNVNVVMGVNNNITFNYTPGTQDGVITVDVNGQTAYELGCFNVTHKSYEFGGMPGGFIYTLDPSTVIRTSNKIMTLMGGGQPMGFVSGAPDEYPDVVSLTLNSISIPDCGALGVPNGVGNSNGNFVKITGLQNSSDDIKLELFDKGNTLMHTVVTNWSVLN